MENRPLYYVLSWDKEKLIGPMTLKMAMRLQDETHFPSIILREVIGADGKEVK